MKNDSKKCPSPGKFPIERVQKNHIPDDWLHIRPERYSAGLSCGSQVSGEVVAATPATSPVFRDTPARQLVGVD